MRIVDYIDHPRMKVTIFHHNAKYSVKLEGGGNEQTLKFREDEFSSEKEVKTYLNQELINKIDQHFFTLSKLRAEYHANKSKEEDFDNIL